MNSIKPVRGLLARAPLATAVAVALLAAPAAQAFEFQKGGLTGSLDTTVSYGISVRTEDDIHNYDRADEQSDSGNYQKHDDDWFGDIAD